MFMVDENEKAAEDIFPLTEKRTVIECESLYTEIRKLRHELAVEQRWHRAFTRLVEDMHGDFKCEPTCSKYGHSELCAATDPVAAFRKLRERIEVVEKKLAEAVALFMEQCDTGELILKPVRDFLASLEKKP